MSETFFCNKCGAQNAEGAQFCNRCGAPTNPAPVIGSIPVSSSTGAAAGSYSVASNPPPLSSSAAAGPYPSTIPVAGIQYGGFWIRVVAAIIDAVLLRVGVPPIGIIF